MGVSRLTSWLINNVYYKKINLSGKKCIVDGCSLTFHITDKTQNHTYKEIHQQVLEWVKNILKHNIRIEVWFDVSSKHSLLLKMKEQSKRYMSRKKNIRHLLLSWQYGNASPRNYLHPLSTLQIIMSLTECNIPLKFVYGEADVTIGKTIQRGDAFAVISG